MLKTVPNFFLLHGDTKFFQRLRIIRFHHFFPEKSWPWIFFCGRDVFGDRFIQSGIETLKEFSLPHQAIEKEFQAFLPGSFHRCRQLHVFFLCAFIHMHWHKDPLSLSVSFSLPPANHDCSLSKREREGERGRERKREKERDRHKKHPIERKTDERAQQKSIGSSSLTRHRVGQQGTLEL